MRERLQAIGGRLEAGPGTGGGWRVHATLPLPAPLVTGRVGAGVPAAWLIASMGTDEPANRPS